VAVERVRIRPVPVYKGMQQAARLCFQNTRHRGSAEASAGSAFGRESPSNRDLLGGNHLFGARSALHILLEMFGHYLTVVAAMDYKMRVIEFRLSSYWLNSAAGTYSREDR
jgi:hypothetical protein